MMTNLNCCLGQKLKESLKKGVFLYFMSTSIFMTGLFIMPCDSGASHNLMPKIVMEKLGLDITRPYKDLYSFDSSKVRCLGLIKYLCVTLAQILARSVVMNIV